MLEATSVGILVSDFIGSLWFFVHWSVSLPLMFVSKCLTVRFFFNPIFLSLSLSLSLSHKAKLLEWLTLLALKFWKTFSASIHFFASNYTQTHSLTQLLALVCGWWRVWYREPCAMQLLHSSFSLTLYAYIQNVFYIYKYTHCFAPRI